MLTPSRVVSLFFLDDEGFELITMAFPSYALGNAGRDHCVRDAERDLTHDRGSRPWCQICRWFPQEIPSKFITVHKGNFF